MPAWLVCAMMAAMFLIGRWNGYKAGYYRGVIAELDRRIARDEADFQNTVTQWLVKRGGR